MSSAEISLSQDICHMPDAVIIICWRDIGNGYWNQWSVQGERLLEKRAGSQASASRLVRRLLSALQEHPCQRPSLFPHCSWREPEVAGQCTHLMSSAAERRVLWSVLLVLAASMSVLAGPEFAHQSWGSSLGGGLFLPVTAHTENSVSSDGRFLLLNFVNPSMWLVRYVGALRIDGLFYLPATSSFPLHSPGESQSLLCGLPLGSQWWNTTYSEERVKLRKSVRKGMLSAQLPSRRR